MFFFFTLVVVSGHVIIFPWKGSDTRLSSVPLTAPDKLRDANVKERSVPPSPTGYSEELGLYFPQVTVGA